MQKEKGKKRAAVVSTSRCLTSGRGLDNDAARLYFGASDGHEVWDLGKPLGPGEDKSCAGRIKKDRKEGNKCQQKHKIKEEIFT